MFGGYKNAPKRVTLLETGEEIKCVRDGDRLILSDLPKAPVDKNVGVTVIKMEFDEPAKYVYSSYYPQIHYGRDMSK